MGGQAPGREGQARGEGNLARRGEVDPGRRKEERIFEGSVRPGLRKCSTSPKREGREIRKALDITINCFTGSVDV